MSSALHCGSKKTESTARGWNVCARPKWMENNCAHLLPGKRFQRELKSAQRDCLFAIFISFGSSLLSVLALGWGKSMPCLNKEYFIFLAIIAFDKFIWRDFVEFLFCTYWENQVVMWFFCFILLTWRVTWMCECRAYLGRSPLGHRGLWCVLLNFLLVSLGGFFSSVLIRVNDL